MNEIDKEDLEMFKTEEKNILREMRGARSRGGHGPMIRQLLEKLTSVRTLIGHIEGTKDCDCNTKKINKVVASKKATSK